MSGYEEGLHGLEVILDKGIRRLLEEVRRRDVVRPPYGREPDPTPLLSEEAFARNAAELLSAADDDDEPVFDFKYGFNPLAFLGDYVRWAHPSSVAARQVEKERAAARLRVRAQHALKQVSTISSLQTLVATQSSGIEWGPLTGPLSSSCTVVVVNALRQGKVIVQVSNDAAFSNVEAILTFTEYSDANGCPTKIQAKNLVPGTKYYLRCCLEEDSASAEAAAAAAAPQNDVGTSSGPVLQFSGLEMGKFQYSSFWTLPSPTFDASSEETKEEDSDPQLFPVSLTLLSADLCQETSFSLESVESSNHFNLMCLLGDVLSSDDPASANSGSEYAARVFNFYRKSQLMALDSSPCRTSSVVLGWNDSRYGSEIDAKSEEVTYKQYLADVKRFNKKYGDQGSKSSKSSKSATNKVPPPEPVLARPPPTPSFLSLDQSFPVYSAESATRNFFRSFKVGPAVEVFVLDFRGGYLCKEQAKWLKDVLNTSHALWKVVLSGLPIAVSFSPDDSGARPASCSISQGTVAASDAPPSIGDAPVQKVQMQIPEPSDHKDIDELGRLKNSLPYLISSLQRISLNDGASSVKEVANDDVSVGALSTEPTAIEPPSASASVPPLPTGEASEQAQVVEKTVDSTTEIISSGIVFVTSSSSILAGGVAAARRYVATFDPLKTGISFCAEINVGSAGPRSSEACACTAKLTPHLETRFLEGDETVVSNEGPPSGAANVCKLRLEADGTLSVKVLELQDNSAVVPVYEKLFKLP
jgi:hypothetical protein